MYDDPRHELLSAYLDDEATPAERAAVETWLESDVDARGELDELAHVSTLIRELPPAAAPRDLSAAVLERVRAAAPSRATEDSLDRRDVRPAAVDTPRAAGRLGAIAALFATIACTIVVAVLLGPGLDPAPELADGMPGREQAEPAAVVADDPRGDTIASRGTGAFEDGLEERADRARALPRMSVGPLAEDLESLPADAGAPGLGETAALPVPRTFLFKEADLADRRGYVDPVEASSAELEQLAPGDVVPFFERIGERVAVVEVTVVDVRRAFGEMQVLLARNEIPELRLGESDSADDRAEFRRSKDALALDAELESASVGADGTFAVYVTTTPMQLAATLGALRGSDLVVDVEGPNDVAGQTFALGNAAGNPGDTPPAASATPENVATPAARVGDAAKTASSRFAPTRSAAEPRAREPAAADRPSTVDEAAPPAPAPAPDEPGSKKRDLALGELAGRTPPTAEARLTDRGGEAPNFENSYQVLRRVGADSMQRSLARETDPLGGSAGANAVVRPEAAAEIRARRIDDPSVRVLILLRPAPR